MLRKRFGQGIQIDMVSGTDFPEDLTPYDLIITAEPACSTANMY